MAMIWLVLGFDFSSETNSKPFISGICTSTKAMAISFFQQILSASLGSVELMILICSTSESNADKLMVFSSLSSKMRRLTCFMLIYFKFLKYVIICRLLLIATCPLVSLECFVIDDI